jgi:hypothetical protein
MLKKIVIHGAPFRKGPMHRFFECTGLLEMGYRVRGPVQPMEQATEQQNVAGHTLPNPAAPPSC